MRKAISGGLLGLLGLAGVIIVPPVPRPDKPEGIRQFIHAESDHFKTTIQGMLEDLFGALE